MLHRYGPLAAIVAVLVLALPAAASADDSASGVLDPRAGVHTLRFGADAVVRFTGPSRAVLRGLRGKPLIAKCRERPPVDPLDIPVSIPQQRSVVLPARGTSLRVVGAYRHGRLPAADTCTVWTRGEGARPVVLAPLTARGAVWSDEYDATLLLSIGQIALYGVEDRPRGKVPTIVQMAHLFKQIEGDDNPFDPSMLVGLAGPDAAPAPGKLGYWSDGDQHLVLAVSTHAGRRLFFELQADNVFSSNVTLSFDEL